MKLYVEMFGLCFFRKNTTMLFRTWWCVDLAHVMVMRHNVSHWMVLQIESIWYMAVAIVHTTPKD